MSSPSYLELLIAVFCFLLFGRLCVRRSLPPLPPLFVLQKVIGPREGREKQRGGSKQVNGARRR